MSAAKKKKTNNKNKMNNVKNNKIEKVDSVNEQNNNKTNDNIEKENVVIQNTSNKEEISKDKNTTIDDKSNKKSKNNQNKQKQKERKSAETRGVEKNKLENKEEKDNKIKDKQNLDTENSDNNKSTKKNEKQENIETKEREDKNLKKESNEKKQEIEENKIDDKADNKKESKEENALKIIENSSEETPEYVKEMLKKKKRKMYISIIAIVLALLVILFSTIFAILNINNSGISKGVRIRNIDVSNLNLDEAKEKINTLVNSELMPEIDLKYGESYNITIKPEQIEFKYKVEDAISKAFEIGRNGNILQNNYRLLATTFFGKNVELEYTYNEELLENFIEDVNSKIPGLVVEPNYYIDGSELIINKGTDGIGVKKDELKKKILDAIIGRTAEETSNPEFNQVIEIPTENLKASNIDIEKIYNEVKREPKDAYFETNPYKIYADVDGIDFNISIEEAKEIINSEDKQEYIIPLKITKANKTINDLGTEAFPYLISSFSTKYDASNRNRSINLEIAANKINGKVLMPGEIFSFNKVVGKRTVEEGYKDAKIYADGGVVDGLAGGICQISSTLYNAVLLGNLEIVERRNHSFPTSYVKTGRDATVVYGIIDFQFKNSRTYPIKIEATVKNGIAEFKIHGMQEEKEYEIKLIPVTTQSIPYTTSYIQDASLLPGTQVVVQSGQPGYKVTTYIEKRLNGELVSKEILSNDTYSPMKAIIRVGSGVPVQ